MTKLYGKSAIISKTMYFGMLILQWAIFSALQSTNVRASTSEEIVITNRIQSVTTISGKFERYGKVKIGFRSTIVELMNGYLAVFSPGPFSAKVVAELRGRPVHYLISPDLEHHLFIQEWAAAYPTALLIGSEDLANKRIALHRKDAAVHQLNWTILFSASNKNSIKIDPEFDKVFKYEFMDGHINKEIVFYHIPSKTLIEADLIWNLPPSEQYSLSHTHLPFSTELYSKAVARVLNTNGKAIGQKLISWYVFTKDLKSYNLSVQKISKWDFVNMIPCHGDIIYDVANEVFQNVMKWHIDGHTPYSYYRLLKSH